MNRPFPRLEVLGLTAALALAGACTPNTSVKPGAPVLIELSIFENGGATITTVTPTTGKCPATTPEGGPCDSDMYAVCESVTTNNLCRCVAGATQTTASAPSTDAGASDASVVMSDAGRPDAAASTSDAGATDAASDASPAPLTGAWSCSFVPTSSVLYVFDRVLDTEFLGDGGGGGALGLATISSDPTSPSTVVLNGDYASNGSPNIVFSNPAVGDIRADGPNILFSAVPALPAGATVSVKLDKTKVLAKDGQTPFTGTNLLTDGTISFATQAFAAFITPPPGPPPAADAGADAAPPDPLPDMTPATVTFNNPVDVTALATLITATATPAPAGGPTVPVDLASMDGLTVTVTPKATWPANSMIQITVDATIRDVVGDTLGAPVTMPTFMTESM